MSEDKVIRPCPKIVIVDQEPTNVMMKNCSEEEQQVFENCERILRDIADEFAQKRVRINTSSNPIETSAMTSPIEKQLRGHCIFSRTEACTCRLFQTNKAGERCTACGHGACWHVK